MVEDEPLFSVHVAFGDDAEPSEELMWLLADDRLDVDDVDPEEVYETRGVYWVGTPGRMYRASWDQVHAFPGNPFDPAKVATFAALIDGPDKPALYAPPAQSVLVELIDVEESQKSHADSELYEAMGMTRPLTTGDEELDEYLADPETFLETYAEDEEDAAVMAADMVERADMAVATSAGDLGKFIFQLRDGNHRAFGAQMAGEPYVWLNVVTSLQNELPDDELE